jgi:hypothetical protein
MAVRPVIEIDAALDSGGAAKLYEWSGLLNTDSGAPLEIPAHADITVSIKGGTLGTGGTVTWEGTLDDAEAPTQYGTVNKADGGPLTQNALGAINQMLEHPLQIRPRVTAGDGSTNLIVRVLAVKQWRD